MKINLTTFRFPKLISLVFIGLIAFSAFVRIQGVGYSNFQGDEVNTIDFLYEKRDGLVGLWEYLMSQKRGPVQYLLNITNVALFGYWNEFQIRIPYLIFGLLALYTLYRFARKIYGSPTALIATTLMGVNGLFIAFARITQYQSIMYFLIPIGAFSFINALNDEDEKRSQKKMLLTGLLMSVTFLTHYDTLSAVPFFVAGFLGYFFRSADKGSFYENGTVNLLRIGSFISENRRLLISMLKRAAIFFAFFIVPALFYYIPFYFGNAFQDSTSGYLENRLFGGGFMPRTQITLKLLTMYIPEFHINFLLIAGVFGIMLGSGGLGGFKLLGIKLNKSMVQKVFVFFCLLVIFSSIFSLYPIKPRTSSLLVIGASIAISAMLIVYRSLSWEKAAIATWFLGAYSFYFFVMKDPRTHVYISMIPLLILAGYCVQKVYFWIKSVPVRNLLMAGFIVSLLFVSGVNWQIFVDKSPEYPWYDKDFMGWPIYRIKRVRHEKIEGVFGFNNYRGWERVAEYYRNGCLVGDFNSNEKNSITYFYTRITQKKGDNWGFPMDSDNLIIVEGPHSWEYFDHENVGDDYIFLGDIQSHGYPVTHVYGKKELYPEGKMLCFN